MASCLCSRRGYVRALEEDDFGFPGRIASLAEAEEALLGRCRDCGASWERLPHYVYGYVWYRTEQRYWSLSSEPTAISAWLASRREQRSWGRSASSRSLR